jgi:hypothetical protein
MGKLLIYLVCLVISGAWWYLIGWFLSSEGDIFTWPWWGKLIYVLAVTVSANDAYKEAL